MGARGGAPLVRALVEFGRLLRREGVDAGAADVRTALEALGTVDATSQEAVYWALRAALVSRREEIEVFDRAFAAFWAPTAREGAPPDAPGKPASAAAEGDAAGERSPRERDAADGSRAAGEAEPHAGEDAEEADPEPDAPDARVGVAWSADERLAELDFRAYGPDELVRARRLIERIGAAAARRRSRRLEPARAGRGLDRRRTLLRALRTGGHPIERSWRRPRTVVRKHVFLVDVSGSMEPYARVMMMFLHSAVRAHRKVEAFSFGTRLTRLTPHLSGREPDRALQGAARAVPDWAGGTRIGENMQAYNEQWGRRGLTRGATVVVVSDGWERGDVGMLAEQMERIHRAAHRVVWVNPLAGDPEYQPLAVGMAAALPHVDVFLPGHDLRSLETLAHVLETLPPGRRHAGLPRRAPAVQ